MHDTTKNERLLQSCIVLQVANASFMLRWMKDDYSQRNPKFNENANACARKFSQLARITTGGEKLARIRHNINNM